MKHAKIIKGEILFYKSPLRIENTDYSINENTVIEREIELLLSQGFKSYREVSGEVEGITETETEIVKTYIHAPVIPRTPEELFNSKQALETLFPYFQNEMYDKDGAVSLIMNFIQYGGVFRAIAMKIDYMHTTNQINDAGYQYFLAVFEDQNINLLSYLE